MFHCLYAKTYSRHQYSIKKNSFNSKLKNGFLNSRIQRSCPRETTTTKQRSEVTLSLLFSCLCNMTQRYRISQSQKTMFTIFFTKLYRDTSGMYLQSMRKKPTIFTTVHVFIHFLLKFKS